MILEVAVLQVKPGRAAEFQEAFRAAEPIISGAGGHIAHELHAGDQRREPNLQRFKQLFGYRQWAR